MSRSESIPVPVMTSSWTPANLLITFNHRYDSNGSPTTILLSSRNGRLFIGGSDISRILQAGTPYLDAVSLGSAQLQQTSAFGRKRRTLCNIVCSVHSLPKLPTPNIPNRTRVLRVGSRPTVLRFRSECFEVVTKFILGSLVEGAVQQRSSLSFMSGRDLLCSDGMAKALSPSCRSAPTSFIGSPQEFDGTRILGRFLENHEFGPWSPPLRRAFNSKYRRF